MASDLPEVPDAPNVFLEALQDEEIADMLQYEADRRRVKGSRPAMHEEPLRVRSIAASTVLAADTEESATGNQLTNFGMKAEVLTLQEDLAVPRKTLPTKGAGKRRASAERSLSKRAKRQSRRSREGECPFASDAEPESSVPATASSRLLAEEYPIAILPQDSECPFASDAEPNFSVPATASSELHAKEYPIAILLPVQDGRNVVIRNGIPAQLTKLLRDEVKKCLTTKFCIRAWNDADHEDNALCMLTAAYGFIRSYLVPKGQGASRACVVCCTSPGESGPIAPRPCVMLRADAKGEYILCLPLPEYLRVGKGWKERGFWVNETSRGPFPRFDALRA
ncbi:hypothetical protein J4E80_010337 [Alternaria sp. BMP 0032]|nr:hypothetical protein J4E80_010337 [Alternaria sp. BMP 0032]